MALLEWFFDGLYHTLRIVLNALSSIRLSLDQDICPVVSLKGPSLDHCYSRCISLLSRISSLHTVSMQMMYADDTQLYIFMHKGYRVAALENLSFCLDDIMSCNLCNKICLNAIRRRLKLSIPLHIFHLLNRLFRFKSVIITLSLPVSAKTLELRLIHTPSLLPMSTTSVALFRVRFILLAESENILRKRILSVLSMPKLVYCNLVCSMEFPFVKLRNFRDYRIPRQD